MDDLRSALKSLRRTPSLVAAAVATLAIGIGGLCAIFGVVDLTLLRPLPVLHEEQMLRLREGVRQPDGSMDAVNVAGAHFQEIAAEAKTLSALTAFSARSVALTGSDLPQHVEAALVSPRSLQIFGIVPVAGRAFGDSEEQSSVLIDEPLARARFGSAQAAVGRDVAVDGIGRRVVGVLPGWFRFPYNAELWLPVLPSSASADDYAVFARMAPGATLAQVRFSCSPAPTSPRCFLRAPRLEPGKSPSAPRWGQRARGRSGSCSSRRRWWRWAEPRWASGSPPLPGRQRSNSLRAI